MKNVQYYIITFCLIFLISACGNEEQQKKQTTEKKSEKETVEVPRFNRDSAYHYIQEQVDFGARVPGSEAHKKTRDYLKNTLQRFGGETQIQKFQDKNYKGDNLTGYNIIGKFNPDAPDRLLLMAHWDSRFVADHDKSTEKQSNPVIGANDGGSGVGVLLEIARILQSHPVDIGIDIVFFDLEDQGEDKGQKPQSWGLGSQYWSHNPHRLTSEFRYGVLLDMVGAENAQFPYEGFSRKFAPDVLRKIWNLANAMGYGNYFVKRNVGGVTDDHYFVNTIAGIPSIDIIDKRSGTQTGFFPQWHTTDDDMNAIDKSTLRAVGQVVTAAIYKESINAL